MAAVARSDRPRASIRMRAVLSAGLVLGLAAGLTVASWTDAEFSGATFTASNFDIETSVNGGAYSSATTVSVAPTGLYPGVNGTVYVSVQARTVSGSIAGEVRVSHAAIVGATGLTAILKYRVVQTAATCTAAAFTGGATYVVGTSTFSAAPAVTTALAASAPVAVTANGGSVVQYCFEFSIASNAAQVTYQGVSSDAMTWTVTGTST